MVSVLGGTNNQQHVFLLTTLFLLFLTLVNFVGFLIVLLRTNFILIVYAFVMLPLPLMAYNSLQQANTLTNSATGTYNTNIKPLGDEILQCMEGPRQLFNAIINIGRAMIHAVAINFYPINVSTAFSIIKNILIFAINFATIIWTMLLNLVSTIMTDFINNNYSFSGTLTAVEIILNFIMDTLLDVLDPGMCFHPISQEPGRFIQCLSNGKLNATDVNNAGFVGFMESVVIIICGIGNLHSDFVNDILLPCTGLDQFFIFKQIYLDIYGNSSVIFDHQLTRFNNEFNAFKALASRIANAGPQIISYIIRKICGGIAFFCKLIKSIGIPASRQLASSSFSERGDPMFHQSTYESFNSTKHLLTGERISDDIVGVCIYRGKDASGELINCYYRDPPVMYIYNADGTIFNTDQIDSILQGIDNKVNTVIPQLLKEASVYQPVQDQVIYNNNNGSNPVNNAVYQFFNSTNNITYTLHSPPQSSSNVPFASRKPTFLAERFNHHYNIAATRLSQQTLLLTNYTSSAAFVALMCAKHASIAMMAGAKTLLNFRSVDNHYTYTRQLLNEGGFDFGEVMDSVFEHGDQFHPSLKPQGFTMDLTMNGVLYSLIFTGLSSVSSAVGFIITILIGMVMAPIYLIGAAGVLMNSMQNTTVHFDLGANSLVSPLSNWTWNAVHQTIPSGETSQMVTGIMGRAPVVLEIAILQAVRFGVLCNFPLPLGPFSCPPQIPMTINEDTIVFDTTLNYIINITLCEPNDCSAGDPDMFGVPCIGGIYNCWGYIPKLDFPVINADTTPNAQQCMYNGTRFTENLSWYNYPVNWLKYTYTDGIKFMARVAVRGYSIPFLVIPGCYLLAKICACFHFPLHIIMWVTIFQYFIIPIHYVPDLCPAGTLWGVCDSFRSYILFPNGDFNSDDIWCFIVGAPVFYYGLLITAIIIFLLLTLLTFGVIGSLIRDVFFVIDKSIDAGLYVKRKFSIEVEQKKLYIKIHQD